MEQCEEESIVRRARVTWLEQDKADELGDRNQWRTGLLPLPSWKKKGKRHAAKRQGSKLALNSQKKRKVEESPESRSPGQNVRLLSDSDESEPSKSVVCVSTDESCHKLGSGLAPSHPELDSIATARSQINPREDPEEENKDSVYRELQELLYKPVPSGSKDDCSKGG